MKLASLRIQKIDQGTETAAHNHNLRASLTKEEKNVNRELIGKNQLLMGRSDTVKAINEKIQSLNLKTAVRKDANRAIEFVLSASPEYFYDFEKAGITRDDWEKITIENLGEKKYWERLAEIKKFTIQENVEKWKKNLVQWVNSDPDLKDNVINLVIHDDEKTLHAHLLVTPIVNGKLTAKQFFTPAKATAWQDSYAAKTNLARGISSEVQHQAKKDFELKKAAKRGYEKGKKFGYKRGYEKGVNDAQKMGAKVGNVVSGLMGQMHKPNSALMAQITEEKRLKDEEVRKAKESAKLAKIEADNRVTKIANELREVKLQNENLSKELDEKDKKIANLLPRYQSQNGYSVKKKI